MSANPTSDETRVPVPSVLPEELALAALAFRGSRTGSLAMQTKHLAWLPPDSLDLDLSDPSQCLFGDYKLVEKLGQGGMGVVYRAQQLGLDREVAIKLLSAGPWAAPDFVMRFRAEAQSAARMQHPNIVPIYEIGVHDELVFYSMRLVRGPNLTQWIAEHGPCDPRQAAMDLRTIAEAVHYAHQLGVLHLDLKPDNILIDERGWPQVADFGLARRLDHTLSAEIEEISGTPSYMAPEQATAGKRLLTPATDIYGLGAIFYEMLTGVPPFKDASPFETLKQVRELAPRAPRELRAEIPRDLEAICLRCLAKNADQRYASARELAEDLMRYLDLRPVQARPLSAPVRSWRAARREPRLTASLLLAFVVLIGGLITSSLQWRRAEDNADTALTTLWQARRDAALTAFESDEWLNGLPGLAINIEEEERAGNDATLDRLRVGVVLDNSPRLIDQIRFVNGGVTLELSPDGTLLSAIGAHERALYATATGAQRWSRANLTLPLFTQFETDGNTIQSVFLSPDPSGKWGTAWMRRYRASDGEELLPSPAIDDATYLQYSRDGHYALVGRRDPQSEMRQLQIWQTGPWQAVSTARWLLRGWGELSPDGSRAFLRYPEPRMQVLDRATLAPRLTLNPPGKSDFHEFTFSPDSRLLSIGYDDGRIELLDLNTGAKQELPRAFTNRVNGMQFSEDSAWIAAGSRDGDIKIWDTATGRNASTIVRTRYEVADVALNHGAHLLSANAGGIRLWSLPPTASEFAQPAPLGPELTINHHYDPGTLDVRQGLLATQNDDSTELRLWRVRKSPLRRVHAAPLHGPDLNFDGSRLVAVDGARVTIVDAWSEKVLAPAMEHPQAVSFAELSADSATLISVSGRELFAWDWRAHELRFAPIAFPNSPQRLAVNPAAATVLVTYTDYRDARLVEMAQVFGLANGTALGEPVALPGPLAGLRFSVDGSRVLSWRGNEVSVRDARRLQPTIDPFKAGVATNIVFDARLNAVGGLLASTGNHENDEQSLLWRIDSRSGDALGQSAVTVRGAPVSALAPDGSRLVVATGQGTFVLSPGEKQQFLALPTGVLPDDLAAAFSPDGRLLAVGIKDGIQLFDAAGNVRLGPPLRIALEMHDGLIQLAFAPDRCSLLGRTAFGHWLAWNVAPDMRPAQEIEREVDVLGYANSAADMTQPLDAVTRTWLRSHDPGPPAVGDDISAADPNRVAPPRDPKTPSELLDLSRYYSSIASGDFRIDEMFDLHQTATGVQRLLGIDFDIRGVVQLKNTSYVMVAQEFAQHVDAIPLPETVATLDLLLGDYFATSEGQPGAEAILHYRDGGSVRLPLRYRTHPFDENVVVESPRDGEALSDLVVPTAWLGAGIYTERWRNPPQRLYLERLVNPRPGRKLKSFSLIAQRALFLVAATVERPIANAKP